MTKSAVLYISYDGMLEPLGQSQVISYLERLADEYHFHILSFEKPGDWADRTRRDSVRARLDAAGIAWHPLTYHKTPTIPATLFDIVQGTLTALWLTLRHGVRLIHARSYLPALMARIVRALTGAKLLFDMRGLWPDERVDAGLWPREGRTYRVVKGLERLLLRGADRIVTLTRASAQEIARFPYLRERRPPIAVIPTCADLARFAPRPSIEKRPFVFGFVGAVSTWSAFDQVLACFHLLLRSEPDARMLVVNRNEHAAIAAAITESGVPAERVEVVAADHRAMPALIGRMTAGAALRRPTYSQVACAPTKLAEYLGCGVPCLVNAGVGDVVQLVEGDRVGVAVSDFSEPALTRGMAQLIALTREADIAPRCIASAHAHFSLESGVAGYRKIYGELLA